MDTPANEQTEQLLFTIAEAAERLKVSYRQMFRFFETGEIRTVRLTPRIIRIHRNDLDEFTNRKRQSA